MKYTTCTSCVRRIYGNRHYVNDTTGRKICPSYKYKRIYQKHKIKQGKFVAFPYWFFVEKPIY